jgi:hypothetical protein
MYDLARATLCVACFAVVFRTIVPLIPDMRRRAKAALGERLAHLQKLRRWQRLESFPVYDDLLGALGNLRGRFNAAERLDNGAGSVEHTHDATYQKSRDRDLFAPRARTEQGFASSDFGGARRACVIKVAFLFEK